MGKTLIVLSLLVCASAGAEDLQTVYDGKIVIAHEKFPGDDKLAAFLRTNAKPDGRYDLAGDGNAPWTFHFMAFLNADPAGDTIDLVFYDAADAEAQKKHKPVQSLQLQSTKSSRILRVADEVSLWPDEGFDTGKTYLVRATRQLKDGTEAVLAEAQVTLSVGK